MKMSSKLDEMRNQFRERLSLIPVPQNARIHVVKIENEFNTNSNGSDGKSGDKYSDYSQTRIIPINTSLTPRVSDIRVDNEPLPRYSDKIVGESYQKLEKKLNNNLALYNRNKTTKPLVVNNRNVGKQEPKYSFQKEFDGKTVKKPMISTKSRLKTNFIKERPKPLPKSGLDGISCRFCDRSFALTERLEKHESVCNQKDKNSRQMFDSTKQRFKGQPNEYLVFYEKALNNKPEEEEPKKWDWRQKHQYCIAAIRAARGEPTEGPTTSEIVASTQQQCNYCKRRFNEGAIKRHLPICAKLYYKNVINY